MDTPSAPDPLLTPQIAAKRIGVHRETIYRWMRCGYMRYVPRGPRRKLIRESEVRRHLGQCDSHA